MQEIKDYNVYVSRMQKGYEDKLFFLKNDCMDNIKGILDFGCADGTLLKYIAKVNPELKLVGYGNNPNMVKLSVDNTDIFFSDNLQECLELVDPSESLLILSSVIHEVYSYSDYSEVEKFWDMVFNSGFKYIAIRDMCVSDSVQRRSDPNDIVKLMWKVDLPQLISFEEHWGVVEENKNLLHYLLKYRYVENWNREVAKDYLHLHYEELMELIPQDKYSIKICEHYVLPFIKEQVQQDFGIEIKDNTHIKLLLEKV